MKFESLHYKRNQEHNFTECKSEVTRALGIKLLQDQFVFQAINVNSLQSLEINDLSQAQG